MPTKNDAPQSRRTLSSVIQLILMGLFFVAPNARAVEVAIRTYTTTSEAHYQAAGTGSGALQLGDVVWDDSHGDYGITKIEIKLDTPSGTTNVTAILGQDSACTGGVSSNESQTATTSNPMLTFTFTPTFSADDTTHLCFSTSGTTYVRYGDATPWGAYSGIGFSSGQLPYIVIYGDSMYTPPIPESVAVDPDYTTAVVTWTTPVAGDTYVAYGLTTTYSNAASTVESVTSHSKTLLSLLAGTTYHYKVCTDDGTTEECSADDTFTTDGGDPRVSPVVSIYDPPPDRVDGAFIWNAYTFRAVVGVSRTEYPDDTFIFDYRITDTSGPTVVYTSPALPYLVDNAEICSQPGICDDTYPVLLFDTPYVFEPGEYSIEARARLFPSGTAGDWSNAVTFTVEGGTGSTPECNFFSFGTDPGDGLSCLWQWIQFVILPSQGSIEFVTTAFDDSLFGFVLTAIEEETPDCPLPTYTPDDFSSGLTMPTYDFCEEIEDATASAREEGGFQTALVFGVSIAALIVAVRIFRLYVAG